MHLLPANQPAQFYRGGAAIAEFRSDGHPSPSEFRPEDWVASTTRRYGGESSTDDGLSRLPDGRLLADAVRADPVGWLGEEHRQRYGDSTALLVKLLDAGQRLPVHCHPSDGFAREHLHSQCGKTEAWIVLATRGDDPVVYTGFTETVPTETVATWVQRQDTDALLGALHAVRVSPGDTVYIPAGLPHAIGDGVFIVELQQPSDLSLTLEWQGFLADERAAHLGIGFDRAIAALDRTGWNADRLRALRRSGPDPHTGSLLVPAADEYFRAHRLGDGEVLPPGFAVLVVVGGTGSLRAADGTTLAVRRGNTVVVPHAAGSVELAGPLDVVACRPPSATQHNAGT